MPGRRPVPLGGPGCDVCHGNAIRIRCPEWDQGCRITWCGYECLNRHYRADHPEKMTPRVA